MGDSRKVVPVIVGILITGLLFASNFEQYVYAEKLVARGWATL